VRVMMFYKGYFRQSHVVCRVCGFTTNSKPIVKRYILSRGLDHPSHRFRQERIGITLHVGVPISHPLRGALVHARRVAGSGLAHEQTFLVSLFVGFWCFFLVFRCSFVSNFV
jgi:hypothetical protein